MFDAHRGAGWLLVCTIPWKVGISLRSLRREMRVTFDRGVLVLISLLLAAATLAVVGWGSAGNYGWDREFTRSGRLLSPGTGLLGWDCWLLSLLLANLGCFKLIFC